MMCALTHGVSITSPGSRNIHSCYSPLYKHCPIVETRLTSGRNGGFPMSSSYEVWRGPRCCVGEPFFSLPPLYARVNAPGFGWLLTAPWRSRTGVLSVFFQKKTIMALLSTRSRVLFHMSGRGVTRHDFRCLAALYFCSLPALLYQPDFLLAPL